MDSTERLNLALELADIADPDQRLARATEAAQSIPGLALDPRDGQLYPFIRSGDAEWTTRNLNFAEVEGAIEWGDTGYVRRSSRRPPPYGLLYTFDAAREAVLPGWRLPTDQDWQDLLLPLGGFNQDGHVESPTVRDTYDALMSRKADRFAGLLGGYFDPTDQWFHSRRDYGFYWADELDQRELEHPRARSYQLNDLRADVRRGTASVRHGFSVRLVRDAV